VRPDEFLDRCKSLWHVAPRGAWDSIKVSGLRTAEQLIVSADLDDAKRAELLASPRREPVALRVDGADVVLRDQGPLLKRNDLNTILGDGLEIADWIRLLNRRVYLFTTPAAMNRMLAKYVVRDGAQDVVVASPLRLLQAVRPRIELTDQNTGAIARRTGPQKHLDTFQRLSRFPNKTPAEVTVVDGISDLGVIVRAERRYADGRRQPLE